MPDGRHIVTVTQGGLALVGPSRYSEQIITPDNKTRSYTTPFPLSDGRILCASTLKTPDRTKVDLGIYVYDPQSKKLTLLYNDPSAADFEARPIAARARPPILVSKERHQGYSGHFVCASVYTSQEKGHSDLYIRNADGSGEQIDLLVDDMDKAAYDWSADGRYVVYWQIGSGRGRPGRFHHHETLSHGGRAGIDHPDRRIKRLTGQDRGLVDGAEPRSDMDADHTRGASGRSLVDVGHFTL